MDIVLIVIHLMVVLAMIGLVLLQRSEGGALGIGGGSGAFMTGRSAGNVLTTSTAFLATAFFLTSIGLAFLAKMEGAPSDIFDTLPGQTAPATAETPTPPTPASGTAPRSAEGMLEQLGGAAGPQTPPEEGADASDSLPVPEGGAVPALEGGPSPQTPPAEDSGQQ